MKHPIEKIKLFENHEEGALRDCHKRGPIKPLTGNHDLFAVYPMDIASAPLFTFFPSRASKLFPRAVYSESDPGSARMTSLPFPRGLGRFASFSLYSRVPARGWVTSRIFLGAEK